MNANREGQGVSGARGPYLDEAAAIAELTALSKNARLWLMDRIGNRLNAYVCSHYVDNLARARESTNGLMSDMQRIGLFETWTKPEEG